MDHQQEAERRRTKLNPEGEEHRIEEAAMLIDTPQTQQQRQLDATVAMVTTAHHGKVADVRQQQHQQSIHQQKVDARLFW